jgi:flagellar biosynthesis/type III secretory pathway M-ring protein FliF/YscJ
MKQFKLNQKKSNQPEPAPGTATTRQEIDALTKQIARHIEKNPKKAAKVFDAWLNGKPAKAKDKKAA